MLEILFLLLPIAAGYGWYMGRRNLRHKQKNKTKRLSRDYFTGLNFLLSDESDKAVDLFISMLDVDDNTIDTHLSLGVLFRKRGEVDRSIRIHQNLIARPNLTTEQRDMAMMELGKDYLAAGFYDRAEEIFLTLVHQQQHSQDAEDQLLAIYQVTKDWQKAIDIIKSLKRKRQLALKQLSAHLYCELADEQRSDDEKLNLLTQAIKQDDRCGRALLASAKAHQRQHNNEQSRALLHRLKEVDIDLFPEALPIAQAVYNTEQDQQPYRELLEQALEKGAGASVAITLAKDMIKQGDTENAETLVLERLYHHPTMKSFQQLMKIQLQHTKDTQAKKSLNMLNDLVEQQIKFRPTYRCVECGFPSHTLYWHCPSCKNWGTIKRVKGLDGE